MCLCPLVRVRLRMRVRAIECVMFAVASHMFKNCLLFVNQLCALLWGIVPGRLPVNEIQWVLLDDINL